jgi:epoxide hydrolase-like predicted phosphatase
VIKLVYFDFGGVLTETGRRGFIGQTLGTLYGASPDELDIRELHLLLRRGRVDDSVLFDQLNKRFNKQVTKEQFVAYAHKDMVRWQEVYDLAQRLRDAGIRTGILSNVFAVSAEGLRRGGWYDGFDPVVLSCDCGYAKPDQELYDLAVKRAGVRPDEILFIDDQDKCLPPAKAMGMHVVQAVSPGQIVADTEALIERENGIRL